MKLLNNMGYDGQGRVKRMQGIISPIVLESRVKHEGQGFDGIKVNSTKYKITYVKEKYVVDFACASKKREKMNEDGKKLPFHPSCSSL